MKRKSGRLFATARGTSAVVSTTLWSLFAAAIGGPAMAQPALTFRFDNQAIVDPPLEFHFQRGVATLDDAGSAVGIDHPRYREPMLLAPLPQVDVVAGSAGSPAVNILAAGVDSDGVTPVWVVGEFSVGRLQVYRGSMTGASFDYNMIYNSQKGGLVDVLTQSVDSVAQEAWRPVSGVVCHGFIVIQCNVAVPGPQGWNSNRIGFMTCRMADLAGPKSQWWRRHSVSDALTPLNSGVGLGAFWSVPTWWSTHRDGTAPTQAWIAGTDYHSAPHKDGGAFMLLSIQRSGPQSTDWTASPVVELPGRWSDPTDKSHAHTLGITRMGEHGLLALGSRGDSLGNAANYAWTLGDEGQLLAGATPRLGAVNWLDAGPVWSGPTVVHGYLDPTLADYRTRQWGNQFIGIAPGPTEGTFLTGSDEVSEPMWLTQSLLSGPAPVRFTSAYPIMQTAPLMGSGNDGPWRHYLSFHIHKEDPASLAGRYVAQLSPSQNDMDGWNNQRILYSPDGDRWAQVWTHFEGTQTPVWIAGDRIWVGSYGKHTGDGIRSIAIPDLVSARPLSVSPGGRNAVVASSAVAETGLGVSVTMNPVLPAWVTAPPCQGPVFRIVNTPPTASTGSSQLGRLRLATGVPMGTREISVKFWVRQDQPEESGRFDSLQLMGKLRGSDAAGTVSTVKTSINSTAISINSSGQWVPVILTTDLSTWANTPAWGAAGGTLDLVLSSAWNVAAPASFYLAFDSVSWEPSPPYPSPPAGVVPNELAEITGFSAPGSWTAFVAGMVPNASWDNSWSGPDPQERPIFSVVSQTGLSWIDVVCERTQSRIVIRGGGLAAGAAPEYVQSFNWFAGSPVLLALTYCAQWDGFIIRGDVGHSTFRSSYAMYAHLDSPAGSIRFGSGSGQAVTAFDVFGGAMAQGEATQADAEAVFRTLPMLRGQPMPAMSGDCTDMAIGMCTADFDGSGFIDTEDFDAFVRAFEAGDDSADFDHTGFVDLEDYGAFVVAFLSGC